MFQKLTILRFFQLSLVVMILFGNTANAQEKGHDPLPDYVDLSTYDQFNNSQSNAKGFLQTVNYTIMSNILANVSTQKVDFNVKVDYSQQVIVEVFDDNGDLVEVVYNDEMPSNKDFTFTLEKEKWGLFGGTHYLRVTTQDYIENHEIRF